MEDLIKREDAIEKICDIYRLVSLFSGGSDRRDEWIDKATYALKDVPSIESSVVRCKDCDNRHTDNCPMYHEEWYEIDEGDGYVDNDFTAHDYSQDDGFCSWAKMKGGNK